MKPKEKLKSKEIVKQNLERFVMHQDDEGIAKVENLAMKSGSTKSWIYRSVLIALSKKYPNKLPEDLRIERPKKFDKPFRQTTICMYGDKSKWFSLCRIWHVELGPLIRFGLELFEKGELELDLKDEQSVKKVKKSKIGKKELNKKKKKQSYRYVYQNTNIQYSFVEYWPKNPVRNLILMKRGLKNRIHPLILPKNYNSN